MTDQKTRQLLLLDAGKSINYYRVRRVKKKNAEDIIYVALEAFSEAGTIFHNIPILFPPIISRDARCSISLKPK